MKCSPHGLRVRVIEEGAFFKNDERADFRAWSNTCMGRLSTAAF